MSDNCRNCAHAEWQMTAHAKPRIKPDSVGLCVCPVEKFVLVIPVSVRMAYGYQDPKTRKNIFSDTPYEGCPLWEAMEK